MNFIVTVLCVVKLSCPLPDGKPIVTPFIAKDRQECRVKVENLIAYYHYEKKDFKVNCEPQ